MTPRKILYIDYDAASRRFVADALTQQGYAVDTAASGMDGLLAAARDRPDLILVDPVLIDLPGEQLAARLRADPRTNRLPIVALSGDPGPARMQACMQAGFSDFLAKSPAVMPAVLQTIAVLLPAAAPESNKGASLVTFLSAKGGTGTSTVCANIANTLAEYRPDARVAVVDLVLPIGSIAGIVGYSGDPNIVTLSQMPAAKTTAEGLRRQLPTLKTWGFQLLAGSPDPKAGSELRADRVGEIVAALQDECDFVLLDLGRSLSRISIPLIERSDLVVVIVNADAAAAGLSNVVWEHLQEMGVQDSSVYAIMNRSAGQEGLTKVDAEKVIGLPLRAAIPHEADNFSLAITHHEPYCHRFPGDTISLMFKQIAMEIVNQLERQRAA
jgi:MinD-like ATPase involved in chromosome partitioning or flagellar assembly/CheY-like chemotaxis protein